jgi:hypothetical protein
MVLIAIVALNLGFVRLCSDYAPRHRVLGVGVLPMTNILVMSLVIGWQRRWNRRFLLGFEVFGAAAVVFYAVATIQFFRQVVLPYVLLAPMSSRAAIGPLPFTYRMLIGYFILSLWIGLPQLVFASIGGFLSRHLELR